MNRISSALGLDKLSAVFLWTLFFIYVSLYPTRGLLTEAVTILILLCIARLLQLVWRAMMPPIPRPGEEAVQVTAKGRYRIGSWITVLLFVSAGRWVVGPRSAALIRYQYSVDTDNIPIPLVMRWTDEVDVLVSFGDVHLAPGKVHYKYWNGNELITGSFENWDRDREWYMDIGFNGIGIHD